MFDSSGSPVWIANGILPAGQDLLVNRETAGNQERCKVVSLIPRMNAFVAVWASNDDGVYAQVVDAVTADMIGPQIRVDNGLRPSASFPSMDVLASTEDAQSMFVNIVWQSGLSSDSRSSSGVDIKGKAYLISSVDASTTTTSTLDPSQRECCEYYNGKDQWRTDCVSYMNEVDCTQVAKRASFCDWHVCSSNNGDCVAITSKARWVTACPSYTTQFACEYVGKAGRSMVDRTLYCQWREHTQKRKEEEMVVRGQGRTGTGGESLSPVSSWLSVWWVVVGVCLVGVCCGALGNLKGGAKETEMTPLLL